MWSIVEYPLMNPASCRGWFSSSVFSSFFVSTFGLSLLWSFLFPFLKMIIILKLFHAVGIRLYHKHLVYSLASVFEMSACRCFYGRLLLSHFSYLIQQLPSPMMLSLVPLLGQCGLRYSVRCLIPIFVLWSYLDHGFIYPSCPGVWSVCLGPPSAFFSLFDAMVVFCIILWLYRSLWWSCIFLCTLLFDYYRRFPPFLVISPSVLVLVKISSIYVAC